MCGKRRCVCARALAVRVASFPAAHLGIEPLLKWTTEQYFKKEGGRTLERAKKVEATLFMREIDLHDEIASFSHSTYNIYLPFIYGNYFDAFVLPFLASCSEEGGKQVYIRLANYVGGGGWRIVLADLFSRSCFRGIQRPLLHGAKHNNGAARDPTPPFPRFFKPTQSFEI